MSWLLIATIFGAGTLATLTDWLFMGVLFRERYSRYPEVWWPGLHEKGDTKAIVIMNGFWIKSDPLVTAAHSIGYLARFLTAGVAAGIVLPIS